MTQVLSSSGLAGGKSNLRIAYTTSSFSFFTQIRSCPGRVFADSILFLTFACVLATFDIRPHTDPVTGELERPALVFDFGAVR